MSVMSVGIALGALVERKQGELEASANRLGAGEVKSADTIKLQAQAAEYTAISNACDGIVNKMAQSLDSSSSKIGR